MWFPGKLVLRDAFEDAPGGAGFLFEFHYDCVDDCHDASLLFRSICDDRLQAIPQGLKPYLSRCTMSELKLRPPLPSTLRKAPASPAESGQAEGGRYKSSQPIEAL